MATVIVCDICNSRENITHRGYLIGNQTCLAGEASDIIEEQFDLCQTCELKILREFIKQISTSQEMQFELNKLLVTRIQKEIFKK